MSVSLSSILSESDLQMIPTNIRNTIDCVLESKCKSLDLEKQHVQLQEKDYNELKIKVEYQSDLVNRYKGHITQLEDDLHKSRRELCESNHQKDVLVVDLKNVRLELNAKDEQLTKLQELIKSKNEETLGLFATNRKLQNDLEQLRQDATKVTDQYLSSLLDEKEKLYSMETKFLKDELERTTNEYHEKCAQLNTLTSEKVNYQNETEIKLSDLKKENASVKNQNIFLNGLIEKKDSQINDLALKLNELHQHQNLLKEQYNIEKKEHDDLIAYYKQVVADSKEQKVILLAKIKELHASFTESSESQKANEEHLNELRAKHAEEARVKDALNLELQAKIEELQLQMINMGQKEVEGAIKQFYPTSSTLSKIFEKNMPLPTVYNKYEEMQAKCQELIAENDELRCKIQEVIAESEKNAPLIFYKTQENKKAYAEIEEYKLQLSKVSSDLENALSEIENYNKINNYLKRELKRYEKSNVDLTRQVQCLVQSVHEIKGNFVSSKFLITDQHLEQESALDRTVSLNLVTFRNIEEIHDNNQKLLAAIRELSNQYQELQDKYQNGDDQASRKHVDELLVEIESLREENRHKQEILSEMMAERESSLNSSKHESGLKEKQGSATTLFKVTSRAYLEEKIAELSNNLEKKIDEFEKFKEHTKEQENQLRSQIKEHLEQINNYQNEIARLSVRLESLNENNKVLNSTLTRYDKEMAQLRERNARLEEQRKTAKEHIGTFQSKKNELVSKLEEMQKAHDSRTKHTGMLEQECKHLKAQSEQYKQQAQELMTKLTQSKDELARVKLDFEVNSVRSNMNLQSQLEVARVQMSALEKTAAALQRENTSLNERILKDKKEADTTILQLKKRCLELSREQVALRQEKDTTDQQLKEYKNKLTEIEQSTDDKAQMTKSVLDLKRQLEEKKNEVAKLIIERDNAIGQLRKIDKSYKDILKVSEDQINKFDKAVKIKTAELTRKVEEVILRESLLKKRLNEQDKKLKEANEKLQKAEQQLSSVANEQKQQSEASTKPEQQRFGFTTYPQNTVSTPPTILTSKVLTASIKPLNRPPATIPQATIPPQTSISASNSPQTAYVVPTSVEVPETAGSSSATASASFSLQPSTSSTISSSTSDQFSTPSGQLKRPRVITPQQQDAHTKRARTSLLASPVQLDSQFHELVQVDQAAGLLDDQQELIAATRQLEQIEQEQSMQISNEELPAKAESPIRAEDSNQEDSGTNPERSESNSASNVESNTEHNANLENIVEPEVETKMDTEFMNTEKTETVDASNVETLNIQTANVEANVESNLESVVQDTTGNPDENAECKVESQQENPAVDQPPTDQSMAEDEANEDGEIKENSESSDSLQKEEEEQDDEESDYDDEDEEYSEYDENEEQDSNQMTEEGSSNPQRTQGSQGAQDDQSDDIIYLNSDDDDSQAAQDPVFEQTDSRSMPEEPNPDASYNEEEEAIKTLGMLYEDPEQRHQTQYVQRSYEPYAQEHLEDGAALNDQPEHQLHPSDEQLYEQPSNSEQLNLVNQSDPINQSSLNMPLLANLTKATPFAISEMFANQAFATETITSEKEPSIESELVIDEQPDEAQASSAAYQESAVEQATVNQSPMETFSRLAASSKFVGRETSNILQPTASSSLQLETTSLAQSQSDDPNNAATTKTNQGKRSLKRPTLALAKKYSIMDALHKNKDKSNDGSN